MADTPAGQRKWNCPDCGKEVLLSITQLDPMACDDCLAKLKQGRSKPSDASPVGVSLPTGMVQSLIVGAVMLVVGLGIGFVLGRMSVPAPFVRPTRPDGDTKPPSHSSAPVHQGESETDADHPDESTRPGAGYKWVRGYTRKDGVKVKGHWAKDPKFDESDQKRKS